jgi:hypothetical protein
MRAAHPWQNAARGAILTTMPPLSLILALAAPLLAVDRKTEAPRVDLQPMVISAGQGANANISNPLTLPNSQLVTAAIPALPVSAVAGAKGAFSGPAAASHGASGAAGRATAAASAGGEDKGLLRGNSEAQAKAGPAAAAAETKGFGAKVLSILARIVNPFGRDKTPEQVPAPVAERREKYAATMAVDHWAESAPKIEKDRAELQSRQSKVSKEEYLRKVGAEIVEKLKARHGAKELGFHYNLHGGQIDGYVDGDGIHATMGDIALNYSPMTADRNYKVYMFRSEHVNLYDVLNESNPAMLLFPSRMGHVFMVIRTDSAKLEQGRKDGGVLRESQISIDFDTSKLRGVPYEAYLVPPAEIFKVPKSLKLGKLSRDEQTLAAMRYIEAIGLAETTPLAR